MFLRSRSVECAPRQGRGVDLTLVRCSVSGERVRAIAFRDSHEEDSYARQNIPVAGRGTASLTQMRTCRIVTMREPVDVSGPRVVVLRVGSQPRFSEGPRSHGQVSASQDRHCV